MKKIYLLILSLFTVFSLGIVVSLSEKAAAEEQTPSEEIKDLFSSYYGLGVYKKDTTIYVDPEKIGSELETYFHAKVGVLERTTYYTKDALWMSRGDGTYSYYGTSYADNTYQDPDGITNGTATKPLASPVGRKVTLKGSDKNSMEQYYVTLNDFIEGTHVSDHSNNETLDLVSGWVKDGSVYTNENPDVIDAFRLFTAPLWLGKTESNENYVDYTKVTVKEEGFTLVMKLWVSSGNSGILVDDVEANGDDLLFSKAVIVKPDEGENLQRYGNLQEGLGTDFEGYSPETHSKLFDPNSSISLDNSGTWFEDNNGENALAAQKNYKIRLIEEADGNVALRIGGYTQKELFRVGLNMTGAVKEAGNYVAKIKVKRGENAVISKFFFKINESPYTDSNHPLSHYGTSSTVDGIFFKNETDPELSTEWTEYSVPFTVAAGSTLDKSNANNFCAAFVMYTSNSKDNYKNDYILIDDFEVYRVDSHGTDFEGFNPTDHASLFPAAGKTISTGWKTDSNGVNVFGVQSGYQAVTLAVDPDDSNNSVLRLRGGKSVVRVALDINQTLQNAGTYMAKVKVRLGTEESTDIGRILIRLNKYSDRSADGAIGDGIYFSTSDDTDSILSASEWTTLTTVFTISEEMSKKLSAQKICAVFVVYTNNDTNALGSTKNYIFMDDLEIYEYSFN